MVGQSYTLSCYFLGCVAILDLYLFQESFSLNPCFKCSKNLSL